MRWRVTFDTPISNVTAANLALDAGAMVGTSIASVTPDTAQPSTSWTVTANTGTSTGILGIRWVGHRTETPSVPNTYISPFSYTFGTFPIIEQNLPTTPIGINTGSTATLTIVASIRGNGNLLYQWYTGTAGDPGAVAIPNATNASYTPPVFANPGTYKFFCQLYTHVGHPENEFLNSATATISVTNPPQITRQPLDRIVYYPGGATFSIDATGTNLTYQWYRGVAPDTSNPIAGATSDRYETGPQNHAFNLWVRVSNGGPVVADSTTVKLTVVGSVTPQAPSYSAPVNATFPTISLLVADPQGAPIPDIQFSIVAPTSGPSGVFQNPGNPSFATSVQSNASGIAIAPPYVANGIAGAYNLQMIVAVATLNLPVSNLPTLNAAAQAGFTNTLATPAYDLATATGAAPAGGAFSGNGVSGGVFTPASAGLGVHTITYSLNGAQVSFTITVIETPGLAVSTAGDVVSQIDGLTSLREAIAYAQLVRRRADDHFRARARGADHHRDQRLE